MLLTRKKTGDCKGRLAYNGKPTRLWLGNEDKSSPTVLCESIMITCAVDAYERRKTMSMDIPNAYIQTDVPIQEKGERIIMKVRGKLVDWLVELDPATYLSYVVIERGQKGFIPASTQGHIWHA